jgi:hypothetical protein
VLLVGLVHRKSGLAYHAENKPERAKYLFFIRSCLGLLFPAKVRSILWVSP